MGYDSVKEVDVALVADVGTMARLPKIVGNQSWVREICLTGRKFNGSEAFQNGFVSKVFDTKDSLYNEALNLAKEIASKSPVAIRGIKEMSKYAINHTIDECNNYVSVWNAFALETKDIQNAVMAFMSKKKPTFSKL